MIVANAAVDGGATVPTQGGGGRHQGHVPQEAGEAPEIWVQARPIGSHRARRTQSFTQGTYTCVPYGIKLIVSYIWFS